MGSKNLIRPDSVASPLVYLLNTSSSCDKKIASPLQVAIYYKILK